MAVRIALIALVTLWGATWATPLPEYLAQTYPKDPDYFVSYQNVISERDKMAALEAHPDPVEFDKEIQVAAVEQAEAALRQARVSAAKEALEDYWAVHQACLNLEIAQINLQLAELELQETELKLQAGFGSTTALYQAQNESQTAHAELNKYLDQLRVAQSAAPIETETLPTPPDLPPGLDIRRNPEYLQKQHEYLVALKEDVAYSTAEYSTVASKEKERTVRERSTELASIIQTKQQDLEAKLADLEAAQLELALAEEAIQIAEAELEAALTKQASGAVDPADPQAGTLKDVLAKRITLGQKQLERESKAKDVWQYWLDALEYGGI